MRFGGIQKTSLIDFPGRIATVLFTPYCNLRCPYCHNWRLVLQPNGPFLSDRDVIQILENRKKFISDVVITGGEPTIHKELPNFLMLLNENGYSIKLDSNGLLPQMLEKSIHLLDYAAIDVKTSPALYSKLGADNIEGLLKSIKILKKNDVEYEFRCTVVPGFVDEKTVPQMGEMVEGAKKFVFQQFVPGDTLDPTFNYKKPLTKQEIEHLADIMESYVEEVNLRI